MQKHAIKKKLSEIAEVLEQTYLESDHLGVMAGLSGVAMFFFYYAKHTQDIRYAEIGNGVLEQSINRISDGYNLPTYCSGIAGMGWVFEHLAQNEFIDIDNDQLLTPVEPYLYQVMKRDIAEGYYDFMHGAMGYGLYFLKRFENTHSPELRDQYESYIEELLEGLQKTAEKDNNGLKWPSEKKLSEGPEKVYNLSLSHGISSITNFLSRVIQHDNFSEKAKPILEGSVRYLIAQEKPFGISLFPSFVTTDSELAPMQSRLAWCYGDLGLGISIYRASQVLNDPDLRENAIRILKNSSQLRDIESCGVVDASPCHGAFGIALIFRTLYKATQVPEFEAACHYWVQEGLNLARHKEGYAGFQQVRVGQSPVNEVNLLEGIAGIGLVMMGELSDQDSNWKECLMID